MAKSNPKRRISTSLKEGSSLYSDGVLPIPESMYSVDTIVSAGYSPSLGFIDTGKILSFVYDIADLYKTETSIPAAFNAAAEGSDDLESTVRRTCRDYFHKSRLLDRIVSDIEQILAVTAGEEVEKPIDSELGPRAARRSLGPGGRASRRRNQ